MKGFRAIPAAALAAVLISAAPAYAYIGPGAGFAFLGSTFVFLLTILLAMATLLFWPMQWAWRRLRGFGIPKGARARRVVILGLDGLEPTLVEKYMQQGMLPNLESLSKEGCFNRLGTTLPALSPVAWSTFQTGVNPGAHNIFDFLTRDKRTCMPEMASTEIVKRARSFLGKLLFPKRKKEEVRITRRSKPFWSLLGERGIFSNVIRVPISYPPEKFNGNLLSAMCTPDLRGSQGTFSYFTTEKKSGAQDAEGGERYPLETNGSALKGRLCGPPEQGSKGLIAVDFWISPDAAGNSATLKIQSHQIKLELNRYSEWIELEFRPVKGSPIHGICRFCLRSLAPHVALYVSPINIHPEKPALPISHPLYFSSWLAKKHGQYGTLGLMEDTWGRNELAIDDQRFLDQAYLTHAEREKMFMESLEKTREGVCVCVFDASDRIQHMFWRYLDARHPSPREGAEFEQVIPEMYRKMDQLVGRTRAKLNPDDVLIVLSDHGFSSFRRGVNLNTWLLKEGYLTLKDGAKIDSSKYLQNVDWSRTKAYAVGLSGIYLNVKGRERQGIVDKREVAALKIEMASKLEALTDPQDDSKAVRKAHDAAQAYRGLYAGEAPDLIVGYNHGYRVSWDSVTGTLEEGVFSDNLKAWSGDHHVDPELVPGIFFSNSALKYGDPNIIDIAPTVLDLFAVKVPKYMEGRVIM